MKAKVLTSGKRSWPRRTMPGGAGLAGISGLGTYVYRAAPAVWKQYKGDLKRPIVASPALPDPHRWPDKGLFAAWIGHSTVLLKIDGLTLITDPVFSDRAGISLGPVTLGIKRLVAPPLKPRQLPKIDLILLSHAHMDHTDLPTLRSLESRHTSVVTAANTSDLLRYRHYRHVKELAWGEKYRMGAATLRAFEVNHWGARMRTDHYRGYNGYIVEAGRYRVLFAGDTAFTPAFRALRGARLDLAIMPIGAYNPWVRFHCTPEEAWRMGNDAGAEFLLPVHHQTFPLGREPLMEPIERFCHSAGSQPHRIAVKRIGQEFLLS